ncbi:MAG TPA: MFS transporter [Kofleriaceae bacterium]|nr:MFS transporter [Kofleriaceae bacterium]
MALPLPLQHRAFGRLWTARTLSSGGDGFTMVAFMLYATSIRASGITLGILLIAEIASTLFSPLLGTLADRFDRGRLMVIAELTQAVIMGSLALLLPPFPVIVALAFARAVMASLVRASASSALPGYIHPDALAAGNAWLRGGEEGANIIGPMLAGVLAPFIGIAGLFAFDAATFLVAGLALVALKPPHPVPAEDDAPPEEASLLGGSGAGLRYVWRHPVARAIAIALFVFVLFAALENVPRPFLAQHDFHAGAFGIALLFAAPQLGMVLGLASMARIGGGPRIKATLFTGMAVYGVGSFVTAASPMIWIAVAGQMLTGFGNGIEVGCVDVLLQRTVASRVLGRVFANVYGGASIAAGLAYASAGPLLDATSARTIFAIVGAGCITAAALSALLLPRGPNDREIPVDLDPSPAPAGPARGEPQPSTPP